MTALKPYRWLAEYYDRIFARAREPFAAARRRILRRIMPHVRSACDLGCGTGDTALEFAAAGIRVYAVDGSPGMCRAVREKVVQTGAAVRVIHADMRAFALPQPVDLITCECDAVNHVPARGDLQKVARAVSRALRPGGYFFFDVNNALGFQTYWRGDLWLEAPGAVAVMRSRHRGNRAWSDIEWFLRDGPAWRRRSERVEEVCWSAEEVERALRRAGFDRVEAFDAARFVNVADIKPGCRTFYLARKVE